MKQAKHEMNFMLVKNLRKSYVRKRKRRKGEERHTQDEMELLRQGGYEKMGLKEAGFMKRKTLTYATSTGGPVKGGDKT